MTCMSYLLLFTYIDIHPNNVSRDRSQDASLLRELKDKMQSAFDFLEECIEPLLSLDWLTQAKDGKLYPSITLFLSLNYTD
jgi:hypothetical protein